VYAQSLPRLEREQGDKDPHDEDDDDVDPPGRRACVEQGGIEVTKVSDGVLQSTAPKKRQSPNEDSRDDDETLDDLAPVESVSHVAARGPVRQGGQG